MYYMPDTAKSLRAVFDLIVKTLCEAEISIILF